MRLGIDVGSTTVKMVVIDEDNQIKYKKYERHMSNVMDKVKELLGEVHSLFRDEEVQAVITGSGGLSLAKVMNVYY